MPKARISNHIEKVGRVMVTDGGHHDAEFNAQVAAEHIAPINPDMTGKRLRAAQQLQHAIADVLEPVFEKVSSEAGTLTEPNPEPYLDDAMAKIKDAAEGTEWSDHFTLQKQKPEWFDAHMKSVADYGEEHLVKAEQDGLYTPLTAEQDAERKRYQRYWSVYFELGRLLATEQYCQIQIKQQKQGA